MLDLSIDLSDFKSTLRPSVHLQLPHSYGIFSYDSPDPFSISYTILLHQFSTSRYRSLRLLVKLRGVLHLYFNRRSSSITGIASIKFLAIYT